MAWISCILTVVGNCAREQMPGGSMKRLFPKYGHFPTQLIFIPIFPALIVMNYVGIFHKFTSNKQLLYGLYTILLISIIYMSIFMMIEHRRYKKIIKERSYMERLRSSDSNRWSGDEVFGLPVAGLFFSIPSSIITLLIFAIETYILELVNVRIMPLR
jgi:hypothetical protein